MEKITASIVVYKNDPAILKQTILSFKNSTLQGKLLVIDNSPADTAWSLCHELEVEYLFMGKNVGFGKAHNIALKRFLAESKYHLVLNPDVYFEADVIQKLYDFMEDHPQAGLVMPKVLYPDGSLQRLCKLLPTPWNLFSRRFVPIKSLTQKTNDRFEMASSGYNRIMEVPFLSGCFMFLRNSILEKSDLFDERFFLYAEDADLSRRVHMLSKTMYYPFCEIYHIHARGSYKSTRLTFENLVSAIKYFNKWGWFFDSGRDEINNRALNSADNYNHLNVIYQGEVMPEPA